MIRVSDVGFNYPGGRPLFQRVSFDLALGETLAILGANGTGKTTFVKCLMNFLRFGSGRVSIDGKPAAEYKSAEFWKIVGYVPQAKNMAFGFTVLETTLMGLAPYVGMGRLPQKEEYEKTEAVLAELGLGNIKDVSCNRISGGQLQMVMIARTLVKEPRILIMDEPESHLDLKNQLKILEIVERLNESRRVAIVLNTHFPGNALRVAQKALMLGKSGHLCGCSREVMTKEHLNRYFEIDSEIFEHERHGRTFFGILPIGVG